jgi:hypothetical protein
MLLVRTNDPPSYFSRMLVVQKCGIQKFWMGLRA